LPFRRQLPGDVVSVAKTAAVVHHHGCEEEEEAEVEQRVRLKLDEGLELEKQESPSGGRF
jgi:hypothetical protein